MLYIKARAWIVTVLTGTNWHTQGDQLITYLPQRVWSGACYLPVTIPSRPSPRAPPDRTCPKHVHTTRPPQPQTYNGLLLTLRPLSMG